MFFGFFFSDISAYPDSVNVLEKIQNDVRTPDKLIDGINDTQDGGHMWLAPILPSIVSYCFFFFFICYFSVFSSPEPKAPGGAYSIGRLRCPSSVRRPSVHNFKRLLL